MQKVLDEANNFYGIPEKYSSLDTSKVVIVSAPYEHTVCYGRGTGKGPEAIINASQYVEFFDDETEREIYKEFGVATLAPLVFGNAIDEEAVGLVKSTVAELLHVNKFVVTLGGEHTIAAGTIAAYAEAFPNLSVLHFDAHSDLRDEYLGNRYSHASAMARVCEFLDPKRLVQVGIRAHCKEEADYIREHGVGLFYAHDIRRGNLDDGGKRWDDLVAERLGDPVYISIDVDVFDPSIMPATGTPEPGGLLWDDVLGCIRKVARSKRIVGFDVVELAPVEFLHHANQTTATMVSKILNYVL